MPAFSYLSANDRAAGWEGTDHNPNIDPTTIGDRTSKMKVRLR